ncbi:uncharacterized protein FA14DRAFT_145616 [Meira miltonrushii]|uniref:Transmembrane protein 135 N-terminal domain-containing protein n=1 Tax=Meira miltonrushii TaxID=1280837 RepID=A0A316VDH8_9BASI|nr:uncharacterized protein FA14DRAFT_145616 [Meira miltonrushii]PWN35689.1 hypothetical protein FA14DRAFT_145616 [Meira miltonrushii]
MPPPTSPDSNKRGRANAGFTIGDGTKTPESKDTSPERRPVRDPGLRLPAFTTMKKDGEELVSESEDEQSAYNRWSKDQPLTPNIAESAQQLRRSLSVHGLHELANMPPKQLRSAVGSKIWRPHDEPTKIPSDWERLAVHVVRGGLRSFNLAFMLRGSVMLVFALIRALRTKKAQGKAFLIAFFGAENIRFSLMFAAWSMLYKATSNSLRLMTPLSNASKTRGQRSKSVPSTSKGGGASMSRQSSSGGHVSGTATPRSGWKELEGKEGEELAKAKSKQKHRAFMRDPRSRVWHAYLAGAVSGLAILVERKDSRIGLAQQLVVRGLEGTYNNAHSKGLISIPNGAVLTFGLACGQIMYAWLNKPETLPRGYISWITQASHISPTALPIHRDSMNGKTASVDTIKSFFPGGELPAPTISSSGREIFPNIAANKQNRRGIVGSNVKRIRDMIEQVKNGKVYDHVPCEVVHPWESSHLWSPVDRFLEVTRWILPVYMTLHFVPAIFLRMRAFRKDPLRVFLRSLFGSVRSSSFLGAFVIIFQTLFCTCHSLHDKIINDPRLLAIVPEWARKFLVGTAMHWWAGFATCLSLFIEHKRRRTELAMYVLPKGMESAWSVARQRSWVPFVPGGDLLLTSAGMSLVMGTYAQNPDHLSGIVRRIVYQFVGRN